MIELDPLELTSIINELGKPEKLADSQVAVIYRELKNIAAQKLKGNSLEYSLSPTMLVNELYLKLFKENRTEDWGNRKQFFYVCSKTVVSTIVDYARRKYAAKRPQISSGEDVDKLSNDSAIETIIAIDDALESIRQSDENLATVIELRFFIGLSNEEIAQYTDSSIRTVQRQLIKAKQELKTLLE